MAKAARKVQYSLFRQKWNIAVTPFSAAVVAGLEGDRQQADALQRLTWMPEACGFFAADPFITYHPAHPSNLLVLYEHFPWKLGRGVIACAPYSDAGFGEYSISLDSPHHLSYPFTLHRNGSLVIIPEHSASRDLSSYLLSENGIVIGKATIDGHVDLLDCTFVEWQGVQWMFATHPGPTENSELYVYYSDAADGPWRSHPANPVSRSLGGARPAGQFIVRDSGLFRPAQDCRTHYGAGIVVYEVLCLTKERFEERPVSEIRMPAGSAYDYGLHTISSIGGHTAIDGARLESKIHPRLDFLAAPVRSLAA